MSDESEVLTAAVHALVGPVVDLEPTCPMCGHVGGARIDRHAATGREAHVPCYLTWSGAHGVTAAVRDSREAPSLEMIPAADGIGLVSAWSVASVECGHCGYRSAPSAFCRPTGPAYTAS